MFTRAIVFFIAFLGGRPAEPGLNVMNALIAFTTPAVIASPLLVKRGAWGSSVLLAALIGQVVAAILIYYTVGMGFRLSYGYVVWCISIALLLTQMASRFLSPRTR